MACRSEGPPSEFKGGMVSGSTSYELWCLGMFQLHLEDTFFFHRIREIVVSTATVAKPGVFAVLTSSWKMALLHSSTVLHPFNPLTGLVRARHGEHEGGMFSSTKNHHDHGCAKDWI